MIYEISVPKWDDLIKRSYWMHNFVFRGQSDSSWGLKTTCERSLENHFTFQTLSEREEKILTQFKRRAHHYYSNPPKPDELLEWLALLQHHGGPTRLLDFTSSFYIAAFFAAEDANSTFSIWAVNLFRLEQKIKETEIFNKNNDKQKTHRKIVTQIIKNNMNENTIINVEPYFLNERMSIQKGLFLFLGNDENTFETTFCHMFNLEHNDSITSNIKSVEYKNLKKRDVEKALLIKMNLPIKEKGAILYDLIRMNITAATLFPGLDGYVRSMKSYMLGLEYE